LTLFHFNFVTDFAETLYARTWKGHRDVIEGVIHITAVPQIIQGSDQRNRGQDGQWKRNNTPDLIYGHGAYAGDKLQI